MQQLFDLARLHAQDGFLPLYQPLPNHFHSNFYSSLRGPLSGSGLEHVELSLLDGEFDILHFAVVSFEFFRYVEELLVELRVSPLELGYL